MRLRGLAVIAAMGFFTLPALAGTATHVTVTDVRFGDHPAYVRVVLDFNGKIAAREVLAGRFAATRAFFSLMHPGGVGTQMRVRSGNGVGVTLEPGTQMLKGTMAFARHRFKYLSYAVVTGNRLALDLWKSAPPPELTGSHTCSGLTLATDWAANGNTVWVDGREHGIFENQFQVVVRGVNGAILGRESAHGPGKWKAQVHYHVANSQSGTVEAVALSQKDGSLECLAQEWLRLPR